MHMLNHVVTHLACCQLHKVTAAKWDCDAAGMLGYVVLLEHLRKMMYLYHVFTILQTVSILLLLVQFWRKW